MKDYLSKRRTGLGSVAGGGGPGVGPFGYGAPALGGVPPGHAAGGGTGGIPPGVPQGGDSSHAGQPPNGGHSNHALHSMGPCP